MAKDHRLLVRDTVYFGRLTPTFRRNLLLPCERQMSDTVQLCVVLVLHEPAINVSARIKCIKKISEIYYLNSTSWT